MRQADGGGVFAWERAGAWRLALVAVALSGLLGACRSRMAPEASGTHIATGDMLSGRLPPQYPAQAFTFEGVESSLLDFTLQSDELNRSAPKPVLTDPQGNDVDLRAHRTSPAGAATTRYDGIILLRTGPYRLAVASTDRTSDSWYIFKHSLRFPSIVGDKVHLEENATHPVSFTAPYGGTVSVRIRPVSRNGLAPDIRGVMDPSGGRALDSTQSPAGVAPAQMAPTVDGGLLLVFVAPRSGRYTVLAAAKPGHPGEASIDVDVVAPSFDRAVWHNGADPSAPLPTAAMPAAMPAAPPVFPAPTAVTGWSSPPAGGPVAQR